MKQSEYIIVGLGNPGEEYVHTRHNVGRLVVERFSARMQAGDWRDDRKSHAKVSEGVRPDIGKILFILPDAFMNRSGGSVKPFIKSEADVEHLIVVHDDIDLPLGAVRIAFNRGSGGHRGVDSINKTLKTKAFTRVRVGVIPVTATGKLKKPKGEGAVNDFILKRLPKKDVAVLETIVEQACDALETLVTKGIDEAMRTHHGTEQVVQSRRDVVR